MLLFYYLQVLTLYNYRASFLDFNQFSIFFTIFYKYKLQSQQKVMDNEQEVNIGYDQEEILNDQPRNDSEQEADYDYIYEQQADFVVLPLLKLYSELSSIISEVNKLVYLPQGWCLILLREFKWDKDLLKEQYYNNSELHLKKTGFRMEYSDPKYYSRWTSGICEVCYAKEVELFFNVCEHNYCMECWVNHFTTGILTASPFVRCMAQDCGCPVLHQTIIGILKRDLNGEVLVKRYQKKLCELFTTTNKNYRFCTGVDCGNCIKLNNQELDIVSCSCGKAFCFKCQSDDHNPCTCLQKNRWVEQVMKEEADAKWIAIHARLCPWCKKAVERSAGCNFMSCLCGKSFCYMCSKPWEPDHKDHFKCHIFKKQSDQVQNREKEVMQKMGFCTQRYLFNQAVANHYRTIDVFATRKYIFKVLRIQLADSEFLDSAYKFAIECCEKLKWIYAYTYLSDIKDQSYKDRFEFALGEYQKYKENLLKMLAVDIKMYISKAKKAQEAHSMGALNQQDCALNAELVEIFTEQFKALKKNIVNYYTCTRNYQDKFVKELNKLSKEHQIDVETPIGMATRNSKKSQASKKGKK